MGKMPSKRTQLRKYCRTKLTYLRCKDSEHVNSHSNGDINRKKREQKAITHHCCLSCPLDTIQAQEERGRILFGPVLLAMYFQPLKDERDEVFRLVIKYLGHLSRLSRPLVPELPMPTTCCMPCTCENDAEPLRVGVWGRFRDRQSTEVRFQRP